MAKGVKYTIGADTSKYERAMGRVKKATAGAEAGINKAFKAAGVVGAAAVGVFGLMARETLKLGDEVHKLNLRLGISTEALSELRHVANLSGVNFTTMAKSYQKMSENISDANQGIGTAKDSIGDLGLNIDTLIRMSPEKQFERVADAMQGISNQSDKVRIAADIFGGRGVEMLQVMAKGAAGIKEMREEAGKLGLTLSQEGANKIAAVNDEFVRFKGVIMGVVQTVVIDLAPTIINMLEWFGAKIPTAVGFAVKAFNAVPAVVAILVKKVTDGLIVLYDILGKVPVIGGPYRDAAAGLREFSMELDNFAATKIAAMETMSAADMTAQAAGLPDVFAGAKGSLGIDNEEKMAEDLARLQEYSEGVAAYKQQRAEAEVAMEETRAEQMQQIDDKILASKAAAAQSQITIARGIITAGLNIAGVEGKKLFFIQKAIDVGMAIMSAYKASAMALAHPPGPPTTTPLAAAALKAGLLSAAAIAATSIGQMTAPAGGTGGGSYISPTVTTPAETDVLPTGAVETKGSLNIIIEGPIIGDETYIDGLVDRINEAEDRDVFINHSLTTREVGI